MLNTMRCTVQHLSPMGQIYRVESFQTLVNNFAPKMFHFGYRGMLCKHPLAALHFNENSERKHAISK